MRVCEYKSWEIKFLCVREGVLAYLCFLRKGVKERESEIKRKKHCNRRSIPSKASFFSLWLNSKKALNIKNASVDTYYGPSLVKPVGYFCFLPQNPEFEFISAEA